MNLQTFLLHKVRVPMRSLVIFGASTVPQCSCVPSSTGVLWFWALPSVDSELQTCTCPVPGVCCVWLEIHWKTRKSLQQTPGLCKPGRACSVQMCSEGCSAQPDLTAQSGLFRCCLHCAAVAVNECCSEYCFF